MLTAGTGALLRLTRYQSILVVASWAINLGVLLSLLLQVGEVYFYSDYYARAFFFYGDEVSTLAAFSFLFAIATNRQWLALLAFTALVTSGGKAAFILFVIMVLCHAWVNKGPLLKQCRILGVHAGTGIALYFCLVSASQAMEQFDFHSIWREQVNQTLNQAGWISTTNTNHRGSCPKLETCVATQFENPLAQRYYSSLAGLWMTMQGGYTGSLYPNTKEKFADLMMQQNPWQMNQRYGLTWLDWKKMGQVQNPYLAFGSGYGPWMLLGMLTLLLLIAGMAISNLNHGEKGLASTFSIFYAVNIIFNQTQSWLKSGSLILLILGFCATSIILAWAARNNRLPRSLMPLLPSNAQHD